MMLSTIMITMVATAVVIAVTTTTFFVLHSFGSTPCSSVERLSL